MATINKISNPVSIDAANIQKSPLSIKAMEKVVKKYLTDEISYVDPVGTTIRWTDRNTTNSQLTNITTSDEYKTVHENLTSTHLTLLTNVSHSLAYTAGLDQLSKYLLTEEFITIDLFDRGITGESITSEQNLLVSIKKNLQDYKIKFYVELIRQVQDAEYLQAVSLSNKEKIANTLSEKGISLLHPNQPILVEIKSLNKLGTLPTLVDTYLDSIGATNVSLSIKNEMIHYLSDLGVDITDATAQDELFGVAYAHARRVQSGKEDPIDNVFNQGQPATWNFKVDYFDSLADRAVVKNNILGAGALDYVRELGENLGIFRCVDTLVLMWAQGSLSLSSNDSSSKLYRYYKLRDNRLSFDERNMIYKQILNKGNGRMLSRMSANVEFSHLWQQLMNNSVNYIQKSEGLNNNDLVSRSRIHQATLNLQQNLSSHMVGKPLNDVHELYSQLQEAIEILTDEEVTAHFATGSDRNMWKVIENISRKEMGFVPNTTAIKTVAVEGNKIFNWIANFTSSSVSQDAFTMFLNSAEAYIISQGEQQVKPEAHRRGNDYYNAGYDDAGYDDMRGEFQDAEMEELSDWN